MLHLALLHKDGSNNPLSVDELIKTDLISIPKDGDYSNLLKKNNCILKDSSEDEILNNIIEMDNKIKNKLNYTKESNLRQEIFWNKFKKMNSFEKYHNINQTDPIGRISNYYLEKNENWFLK